MTIYPDYYKKFRCIADRCRHSCCTGWQICIDDKTFEKYINCRDLFSQKLKENIDVREQCFVLDKNQRCPFLNDNNLCDIIINKDESWLCDICAEHPRFRNYIGDTEQIGLGLSCEEAARIILNKKDKTVFSGEVITTDKTEKSYFALQKKIIGILQCREKSLICRFEELEKMFGAGLSYYSPEDAVLILKGLERLEKSWDTFIEKIPLGNIAVLENKKWQIAFEQLAVYFIYRHLPGGFYDGKYIERIALACFSVYVIAMMFEGKCMEELEEIARRFSSEVEYSEENVAALLDVL